MEFGCYTLCAVLITTGLVFFLERKNKHIAGIRALIYMLLLLLVSISTMLWEILHFNNLWEYERKISAKLILPISVVDDSSRKQYVLVYFNDSLKTTTIPKDDVFVSPEKLKIYTYPLTIIQQR